MPVYLLVGWVGGQTIAGTKRIKEIILGILFVMAERDVRIERFVANFHGCCDVVVRPVGTVGCLVFLDGLSDSGRLEKGVLAPLADCEEELNYSQLIEKVRFVGVIREGTEEEGVQAVACGDAVLLWREKFFFFSAKKINARSVSEPPTGTVVKGPREGFVEDYKTNLALLRKRIKSSQFICETVTMGRYSETQIILCYIKGVAVQSTVEKVKERLRGIEIDGIVDSSYVAKMICEYPYSMIKQVGNSEKPDIVTAKILDGRVAIMVDGSPIVLTIPFVFMEDFEDIQDRYKMPLRVTFLRLVRIIALFFALVLPASFVAVQSHQYQILPLQLMITILNSTEGIPFDPMLEMLIALVLFEILTEASIRMPKHVGMALSVVGAIVLGQTAVEAGFLSSLTVLVVALSGIGIYTLPDQVGPIGLFRMVLVLLGGVFGIYGILSGFLAVLAYLGGLTSFEIPYLSPFAPMDGNDLKNVFLKQNVTDRTQRPYSFALQNRTKLKNDREVL